MMRSPFDPDTHYRIRRSETPVDVDGYKIGEPKKLVCDECGASVLLTEEPSPGVDDGLPHDPQCSQRWAKTRWWRERFDADGQAGD